MAIRGDAAGQAFALPTDPEPEMGAAASRLDPARARMRRLPDPKPLTQHGPAQIIAMCNQKGGVGKTTSTINLGAALVEYGRKVLLIDLDPQGALSVGLGVPAQNFDRTIYNALMERRTSLKDVRVSTDIPGLDLVPSNIDLSAAEVQLVAEVGREHTLVRALRPMVDRYDYILIDCPPSLGLLTINALLAADEVHIPIAMTYLALEGVGQVMDAIEAVKRELDHPTLAITGVIPTFFDGRTRLSREILQSIRDHFGEVVFATAIRKNVKLDEAQSHHQSIFDYDPRSAGALEYESLVEEVIQRESTALGRESARETPG